MFRPFRHPLASHAAGTILGHRRDGRPIHAIAGGSGDGGPAPAAPAAPTPAAPVAPAAPVTPAPPVPQAPPAPPVPAAPTGEPQDVASLPQWAQQLIGNTRAEAAQWRTRAQGTAPQPGDPTAPPAPAQPQPQAPEVDVARLPRWAQQAVTDGQGAARTLAIQTALIAAAPAAGADITRLLDSQAAMNALAAVDPTNAEAVKQAITNTLTTHPHLAAQTGPIRGGAEFGGAPTGERKPATLEQAIAARMSGG
jgi:hypothetical protein